MYSEKCVISKSNVKLCSVWLCVFHYFFFKQSMYDKQLILDLFFWIVQNALVKSYQPQPLPSLLTVLDLTQISSHNCFQFACLVLNYDVNLWPQSNLITYMQYMYTWYILIIFLWKNVCSTYVCILNNHESFIFQKYIVQGNDCVKHIWVLTEKERLNRSMGVI